MARRNLLYPAGEKAHHDYAVNAITLNEALYALIVTDTYDPEVDQGAASLLTVGGDGHVADHLWDGTFVTGGVATDSPILVAGVTYSIDGTELIMQMGDIDFTPSGAITSVGTTTPGYIVVFCELSVALNDAHRFPYACFECDWTPVLGDTFKFHVDPIAVARWRM